MFGFPFQPTWPQPSGAMMASRPDARFDPLSMSAEAQLVRFWAAPSEPAYMMKEGYGDQNSATLYPTDGSMVPEQTGLFGPLFGQQTKSSSCPPPFGVGPAARPATRQNYGLEPPGHPIYVAPELANPFLSRGFPQPPSSHCPIVQNIPYPTMTGHWPSHAEY